MRVKPDWLNYGSVGYLILGNHTEGPFCYKVVYPNSDYKGTFCLFDSAMTEEQTMLDVLPFWEAEKIAKSYGYGCFSFEQLYTQRYTKIKDKYYTNIAVYGDIVLYGRDVVYQEYKTWFCKSKKVAKQLWALMLKRELQKIENKYKINFFIKK